MPRVSPEHSAARRAQIITAARACFLRDGFHQTSMQDIQREAGLSAGAIYLYFKSKQELILAIAQDILGTVGSFIPDAAQTEGSIVEFSELVSAFLEWAEEMDREHALFPIALMVWSEATRDASMLDALRSSFDALIGKLRGVIERYQARGLLDPDADPLALTMATLGWVQGFIVQRTLFDRDIRERYIEGLESLLRYRPPADETS